MLDLAFCPDRAASLPLYRQLSNYLTDLIVSGRLRPGEKLPPSREAAAALGVGRNTVNQAYQILIDDGSALAHVGQGTFVSSRGAARSSTPVASPSRAFAWDGLFARSFRTPSAPPPPPAARFDFGGGRVDEAALPLSELRRAYAKAIGQLPALANDLDPLGQRPLREEIARSLVSRGVACEPRDVAVVSGAQQALDLIGRVLLDPGDAVAVEQPGYFGAAMSFRANGAQLVGIDVDREGIRTDALARTLRSRTLKLVYTTPAAQMPTGVLLSNARRQALLELADDTQTPILEDDYDSEFRFGNPPQPALKTRDRAGQVIYVGTFSKALFPTLRLGYLVAARPLLTRLATARFAAALGGDALTQAAITELLASGALERHVRELRKRYTTRRAALLASLEDSMPEGTIWTEPHGGLAVWVSLPPDIDAGSVYRSAREHGIHYLRGEACYFDGRRSGSLALSFANQSPDRIAEGVARLSEIASGHRLARRSA